MDYRKTHHSASYFGISGIWINWAISTGSLALVLIMSLWVNKVWLPAVVIALQFILMARVRGNYTGSNTACLLMPYLVARILFVSAVIMVLINLYYMYFINPEEYITGTANKRIPYITILVLAPVTFLTTLWAYLRRGRLSFCYSCTVRFGNYTERGFLGRIYRQESLYQVRLLMRMSAIVMLYTWIYYLTRYHNVNLNHADLFYYVWIPVILVVLASINILTRYIGIYSFYCDNVLGQTRNIMSSGTLIRFLILCDDTVLLSPSDTDGCGRIDTPASIHVPYRERVTPYDAEQYFNSIAGTHLEGAAIRFLYENSNDFTDANIFHFLVTLNDRELINRTSLRGLWITQGQLQTLSDSHMLTGLLLGEIHRVVTMTKAFKTYDRNGYRLYNIKHYKPSVRIRDVSRLDIDYNDPHWLFVAKDNEDQPLFRLRRWWKKLAHESRK